MCEQKYHSFFFFFCLQKIKLTVFKITITKNFVLILYETKVFVAIFKFISVHMYYYIYLLKLNQSFGRNKTTGCFFVKNREFFFEVQGFR